MKPTLDIAALVAATPEVALVLLGPCNRSASRPGELRYRRRGSLVVFPETATFKDFESGEGGGLLCLIARERRCSPGEAVAWLRGLGLVSTMEGVPAPRYRANSPEVSAPKPSKRRDNDGGDRIRRALMLWGEAVSAEATIAERYLRNRGLELPPMPSRVIRYHASCPFGEGQRLPCVFALMRDIVTGAPCGIHRTALTAEGAQFGKKMLGRAGGAAIMLSRSDEVTHGLGIAEGLETALSVLAAGWAPVWSLCSAGGIAAFPLLDGIEALTVFADADEAGQKAAHNVARRYVDAGRAAYIQTPPDGDFNDRLRELTNG